MFEKSINQSWNGIILNEAKSGHVIVSFMNELQSFANMHGLRCMIQRCDSISIDSFGVACLQMDHIFGKKYQIRFDSHTKVSGRQLNPYFDIETQRLFSCNNRKGAFDWKCLDSDYAISLQYQCTYKWQSSPSLLTSKREDFISRIQF